MEISLFSVCLDNRISYHAVWLTNFQAPSKGGLPNIDPKVESLKIVHTTNSSILVRTSLNFTNPTNYSANVPYIDLKLVHNSTDVARLIARDLTVSPGLNTRVEIDGLWNPLDASGEKGVAAGRDLLSQFVSGRLTHNLSICRIHTDCILGYNTTITLQLFNGSIPALPLLGQALSRFEVELPVPKLRFPDGDNNDTPDDSGDQGFIKDATVLLSIAQNTIS